ncbi:MAG: L-seryl-tRNA(Sec) selenium transferase [Candidatus Eremiobacteraeota bacterium]|nr:L-seryl-tRNA(Sec) selenium transferase [Candidatus Eremiobacteraeota bacterium]
MKAPLREVPPVHRFTTDPIVSAYDGVLGHGTVRSTVAAVLDQARAGARDGAAVASFESLRQTVLERLALAQGQGLVRVVNGTGILLHTNFGRAPLAPAALAASSALGMGYTNLEYDLGAGKRGSRYERVSAQLCELSGAESALVVNNCAAAVLLVLDTFARDREVVVSRGQLIEIGGGFRLPDVLRKSGSKLVEVGTTNKTYPLDYRNAWSQATAIFMRTHPSNYRTLGFTAEVDAPTLAALAKELGVLSFEDLGSGALVDMEQFGLQHEPTLAEEIKAGIDLVAVSGDKLLGGPQCGIIVGRADRLDTIKRNPLLRALRVDKLTLAALAETLACYLEPGRLEEIPLFAMLKTPVDVLRSRADAIRHALRAKSAAVSVEPCATESATGGGTLPLERIPSSGIAITARSCAPDALAAALRRHQPPVIGRIEDAALVIDLRTVMPDEDQLLVDALASVV